MKPRLKLLSNGTAEVETQTFSGCKFPTFREAYFFCLINHSEISAGKTCAPILLDAKKETPKTSNQIVLILLSFISFVVWSAFLGFLWFI